MNDQRSSTGSSEIWQLVAQGIQDRLAEGDGIWVTCTGCHESEDGYDVGYYPHSDVFGCKLGGGCGECGGIGAVWDTTDYGAMADELHAEMMVSADVAQRKPDRDGLGYVSLKIAEKIAQLRLYRDNACQLEHAKTIADGRIAQAEMDLRWVHEALAERGAASGGEVVAWRTNTGAATTDKRMAEIWRDTYNFTIEPLYASPPAQQPAGEKRALQALKFVFEREEHLSQESIDEIALALDTAGVSTMTSTNSGDAA